MDALVIAATLLSSLIGAFLLQKAALAGLFRLIRVDRHVRR